MNKIVVEAILVRRLRYKGRRIKSVLQLKCEDIGNLTQSHFIEFVSNKFPGWTISNCTLAEV